MQNLKLKPLPLQNQIAELFMLPALKCGYGTMDQKTKEPKSNDLWVPQLHQEQESSILHYLQGHTKTSPYLLHVTLYFLKGIFQ